MPRRRSIGGLAGLTAEALRRRRHGLLLLAGAIGAIWLGVLLHLSEVHRQAEEAAHQSAENLARGLEQNIIRAVEGADQMLRFLQATFLREREMFALHDWAAKTRTADGLYVQLALIGPDGRMLGSSLDPQARPVDLSDREHFRVHLDRTDDLLFISRPVLGRVSGRWTIQFTRAVREADGRLLGVFVLSMDTDYLSRFYESLRSGNAVIALAGLDGVIRARAPALLGSIGESLPAWNLRQLAAQPQGTDRHVGADGVDRYHSYRTVAGYPLAVFVGLDAQEALAGRDLATRRSVAAALAGSLVLFLVGLLLLRQAEQLERGRTSLRLTLERMGQGVVMSDPEGRVQVLNPRARALLELPERLAETGAPVGEILAGLGDPVPGAGAALRERRTARGARVETQIATLPGGGLLLTSTDVTAQRALLEAQAAALDAARAANAAKSNFLANMSHEIRTPMNGVMGMLQLLRHSGLNDTQRAMCETMTRSADGLLRVLNDILDYSKLEAGRVELELEPCALDRLAEDVTALMRGAADAKGIGMRLAIAERPPTVLADPTRLRQILGNLLANAVKFSEAGEITVTLDARRLGQGRVAVSLAVRDEGIGIGPEALEHLFSRFSQADASSTRRFGGTGLGLAISRELARLMGGDITVESRPDEGAEFTLRLTLEEAEAEPEAAPEPAAPGSAPRRLRILIAEDDEINRMVIASFLEPHGHGLRFAPNGLDAVLAMREAAAPGGTPFDLVLMDVMMPGMDGPTATRQIRAMRGPEARTPIIALTANAMAGDRERYLAAGMDGYVSKPIDRGALYATIESVLRTRAFAPAAPPPEQAAPGPSAEGPSAEVDAEVDDILAGLKE